MNVPKALKKYSKKIQQKFFIEKKKLIHALTPPATDKKMLFIIGCQRSGTTMMLRIFRRDLNSKVFGEFSKLSRYDPDKIRLNPLATVSREIEKEKAPLIVIKPLVETQNIDQLLDNFSHSRALWMYRHYKDVAASNLKNFGKNNGIEDLRPIVEGDPANWRSEGASPHVREVVKKHFSEDMPKHDAAALFWYARNSLFFDLNMKDNPRIMMCRYDDLVYRPTEMLQKIYDFIALPFPGAKIIEEVKTSSVGKGKNVKLNPEIEALCQQLLHKLDKVYLAKQQTSTAQTMSA
jgi:hypothetical protein